MNRSTLIPHRVKRVGVEIDHVAGGLITELKIPPLRRIGHHIIAVTPSDKREQLVAL